MIIYHLKKKNKYSILVAFGDAIIDQTEDTDNIGSIKGTN